MLIGDKKALGQTQGFKLCNPNEPPETGDQSSGETIDQEIRNPGINERNRPKDPVGTLFRNQEIF